MWQTRAREVSSKSASSFEAYDYRLRGLDYLHRLTKDDSEHVAAILAVNPNSTLTSIGPSLSFKNRVDLERILDGLRKAGMPE